MLFRRYTQTLRKLLQRAADINVNVNGRPLSGASRITMTSDSGAKTGAAYENDQTPGLIDWPPPPVARVWTNATGDLNWYTAGNWSPSGAPAWIIATCVRKSTRPGSFLGPPHATGEPLCPLVKRGRGRFTPLIWRWRGRSAAKA